MSTCAALLGLAATAMLGTTPVVAVDGLRTPSDDTFVPYRILTTPWSANYVVMPAVLDRQRGDRPKTVTSVGETRFR
jgi:hypothetical protein